MKKSLIYTIIIIAFGALNYSPLCAQITPPAEGSGSRYIRIAELGQLADTVNVLGDVSSEGRYIIPKTTNLPELMAFSEGYGTGRGRLVSSIGGGKTEVRVKVSRYNASKNKVNVQLFKYRLDKSEPPQLYTYNLQNNDVISVEVRRKPSFGDYVRVIAPVVSVIATSVLLFRDF